MATTNRDILVDDLLLDLENPRYPVFKNQEEAIQHVIDNGGAKFVNLAKDIAVEGLNPTEISSVIRSETEPTKYVILEGNRRLTALKLLLHPELIDLATEASFKRQLRALKPSPDYHPIVKLPCIVFEKRRDPEHWLELRHTGPNEGVGIAPWGPEEQSRFKERLGKTTFNTLAIQIKEYLRQAPGLDATTRENVEKAPITNVARLGNDPAVREGIGIELVNGQLASKYPEVEVLKGLTKIINDLARPDFNVNDIRGKQERQAYIESFGRKDRPDPTTKTEEMWTLVPGTAPTATPPGSTKKVTRSVPLSTSRKALIPISVRLRIKHPRLNQIHNELRHLSVDQFPNCAAVMLRVFLEQSVDEFAAGRNLPGYSKRTLKLHEKLTRVADYMAQRKILEEDDLKAVRLASSKEDKDKLFTTNTLNAYVHNSSLIPSANELKVTWDNMEKFVVRLWNYDKPTE